MKNMIIIGATGTVGSQVRGVLNRKQDIQLTLVSRHLSDNYLKANEKVVSCDATNVNELAKVMANQDAVFVAVSGQLDKIAQNVVESMKNHQVERLVFITSMGIYNEIPSLVGSGNLNSNPFLKSYRRAADIVESSGLNYTLIRPGWFDNGTDDYEISLKGEPFKGHDISIKALGQLSAELLEQNELYSRQSIGVSRP